jgi:hypothetical protein
VEAAAAECKNCYNKNMQYQYAWLIWSLMSLVIWAAVYLSLKTKEVKKEMLVVSLWTSLFGATEPLFVPEYWNPPSLFNLAEKTGFDIESFIFCFAVGGLAVVIYEWLFGIKHKFLSLLEKQHPRHRIHLAVFLSAPLIFFALLALTDLNPIYSAIITLMTTSLLTWYCRPDLKKKMLVGAGIFLTLYFFYFLTLIAMFPGYVERAWNLAAISGILILGVPLEELLFAFSFGFLWSSIYEHITWRKI